MTFNYDLLSIFEYFIGTFICCLSNVFIGFNLLQIKPKHNHLITLLIVLILSIITLGYSLLLDNIVKVFMSIVIMFCNYYFIFGRKGIESLIYGIITYILFIIGEICTISIIMLLNNILKVNILYLLSKSIIANIFIVCISYGISFLLKDKLSSYINKISNKVFLLIIQAVIVIFVSIASINYLYINNWILNYQFILSLIIIIGSLFLIQSLIKQQLKNKEIIDKYILLEDYLKTSAYLIEKYSTTIHKYENNLIAVKGYYKKSIDEGNKYVDLLLKNNNNNKYKWVNKLNDIPFESIRYFIYYKLSKAEELSLKIFVNVEKNIKKIKSNLLNMNSISIILEIIGEYFDNALYASKESKEKEINLNIYQDNDKLVFEIANSFINNININNIYKNGYTTKGKGHGLGLFDVDKSIKENDFLDGEIFINDNYFVSKLILLLNKKEHN